jgi:hypothetical protein
MSINHNVNRKKIRGWKRRIKQLDEWGKHIKQPYLKHFKDVGDYTYERCFLYPFYTLEKRQPPIWFYKLIIAKFIMAYDEWEKIFNDLGIPYDLQLWIYDPNFMWSEIICRRVENKGDRISYSWESGSNRYLPYSKFADNDSLKKFEWISADEEVIIFESELENEDFTAEDLITDGYIKKDSGEHGFNYAKRIGDLWIGRKKGPDPKIKPF